MQATCSSGSRLYLVKQRGEKWERYREEAMRINLHSHQLLRQGCVSFPRGNGLPRREPGMSYNSGPTQGKVLGAKWTWHRALVCGSVENVKPELDFPHTGPVYGVTGGGGCPPRPGMGPTISHTVFEHLPPRGQAAPT